LGNFFIGDGDVLKKALANGTISTVAGNIFSLGCLGDGGPAISATFEAIEGLAIDGTGNLFLTDAVCQVIRKVSADGVISLFAGSG
jgi:hypothetical protein